MNDNVIKFEDAFIKPEFRGKGIYKMLWNNRLNYVNAHFGKYTLIAYCKPSTLDFYKKRGFTEKETITLVEKPA